MQKALYIIEYDNGDNVLSEWFVADNLLSQTEMIEAGYKHLQEVEDEESVEVVKETYTILNSYRVSNEMILEVANS